MQTSVLMTLLVAACAPPPESRGARLFAKNCVVCHGVTGEGEGSASGQSPIAPASLRGLRAVNGGIFPTRRVMASIQGCPGKSRAGPCPSSTVPCRTPPSGGRLRTARGAKRRSLCLTWRDIRKRYRICDLKREYPIR
ncbi:c-type cytochrome [Ruegeria marina]|uniref:c-type cytochrome n=1 Tax=Ruegeria marina TaxID=639004 RepID=UPI000B873C28